MLTCQQTTQLLSERQDRALLRHEKFSVTLHISLCSSCRRFGTQMTQLSRLSKQYRQYHQPESDTPVNPAAGLSSDLPSSSDEPDDSAKPAPH